MPPLPWGLADAELPLLSRRECGGWVSRRCTVRREAADTCAGAEEPDGTVGQAERGSLLEEAPPKHSFEGWGSHVSS